MAHEFICMDQQNERGIIALNSTVFETIASYSCEDIKGVALVPDKKFFKSVSCKVIKNQLVLQLYVNMKQGYNLDAQCEQLQATIKKNIETMTGLKQCVINVAVTGFDA